LRPRRHATGGAKGGGGGGGAKVGGSRHTQDVNSSAAEQEENKPVNAPVPKADARLVAAGEARYTDDEPMPKDCLYAAFAVSTQVSD
jgi:hypothetical protein